jgi:hypothetical protein
MELSVIEKYVRPDYYCKQKNLSRKYVAVSPLTYFSSINLLDSDYLNDWERHKIRQATTYYQKHYLLIPLFTTSFFYYYGLSIMGYLTPMRPQYKIKRLLIGLMMGGITQTIISIRTYPSKDYHELLTQPEPRGAYLRTAMKESQPRIWALLSKELADLGFNFKEMNEYSNKETMPNITTKQDDNLY